MAIHIADVMSAHREQQIRAGLGPDSGIASPFPSASGMPHIFYVDGTDGGDGATGLDPANPLATIQQAIDNAVAARGDVIYVQAGEYDEEVTVNKSNVTIIGLGGRGATFIAPTAADPTAVTVTADDVTLINIGCEGDGTGGGLHVQGDVSRFRAVGCKVEGGTFGAKLESTAAGSVGDTRFEDCEFAWTTSGLHLTASGGGDPVTQTYVGHCLFHNCSAEWILSDVAHTTGLWVKGCTFAREEDASAPAAGQIDVAVASSEGIFEDNSFALATMASATLVIAAGILWVGNKTEAGVGGRPS